MVKCFPRAVAYQPNQYARPFDQNLGSPLIYLFYMHTIIGEKYMVLFHLIFLLCTIIRPKIGVHTDLFFFCTRPFEKSIWSSFIQSFFCVGPFDQKLRSILIYIFMYTTIRPKVRVLINLFILFVHDHSTKNQGPH